MRGKVAALFILTAAVFVLPSLGAASSLRSALIPPRARDSAAIEAAIRPLGNAIGSQVANQVPSLSTSAGFTYEYNPDLEVYQRSANTFGPLFAERAVTIGRGKFNVNASYSWVRFDSFNGKDLGHLRSRAENARLPEAPDEKVFAGIQNENGYFTQLQMKLNLEAQLFDFSFTYGLLDNLDVNLDIPVLLTYARSGLTDVIPDPRCVRAGVQQCVDVIDGVDPGPGAVNQYPPNGFLQDDGFYEVPESAASDSSLGIGDIHLRAKYLALRRPIGLAGLLDLGLPTGDIANFQGTGDTTLRTMFIVSRDVVDRLEVHSQAGIEFTVNDVDRSQARYGVGLTGQVFNFAALTVDFLGRSEFNPQGRIKDSGRLPEVRNGTYVETLPELQSATTGTGRGYFVDIKRNDILELAVGLKLSVNERTIVFANFLVPLNDDGLRADFVPTLGAEVSF